LLALQCTLPVQVPRPDAVLLLLTPLALQAGSAVAGWFGFLAGLVLGLLGPGTPGLFAAVYGLAGVLLGSLGEGENLFMNLLLVGVGTVTVGLALAGVSALGGPAPAVGVLKSWLGPALILNVLLAWPARSLFRALTGPRAFRRGL